MYVSRIVSRHRIENVTSVPYLLCHNSSKDSGEAASSSKGIKENAEMPEEPTTCCMSGCANCVWLDYVEKLSKIVKDGDETALKIISEKISDPNMKAFLLHELKMRKKPT